jgi:hypothetical protein
MLRGGIIALYHIIHLSIFVHNCREYYGYVCKMYINPVLIHIWHLYDNMYQT